MARLMSMTLSTWKWGISRWERLIAAALLWSMRRARSAGGAAAGARPGTMGGAAISRARGGGAGASAGPRRRGGRARAGEALRSGRRRDCRRRCSGRLRALGADDGHDRADRDLVAGAEQQPLDDAAEHRLDLDDRLLRVDPGEDVALLNTVAGLLEPGDELASLHVGAEYGHY